MTAYFFPTQAGSHSAKIPCKREVFSESKWEKTSVSKWDFLKAAEDAREPLGLKRTSLALLRAMVSLVRSEQISGRAADEHICFARNSTLAERMHVSIATVERHISALVGLGLIERVVSGNRKRWARRNGQGQVVLASGLSLLPLAERHAELLDVGRKHKEEQRKLSLLKDKCLLHLQSLRESVDLPELFSRARNVLRRKPSGEALNELLQELEGELSAYKKVAEEPDNLRASDTHSDGHKETHRIQYSKEAEFSPQEMEYSFPKLCAELRCARSKEQCDRMLDNLARYLGVSNEWLDLRMQHGPAVSFMLLGYVFERADSIKNHRAYILSIAKKIRAGDLSPRSLLARKNSQR